MSRSTLAIFENEEAIFPLLFILIEDKRESFASPINYLFYMVLQTGHPCLVTDSKELKQLKLVRHSFKTAIFGNIKLQLCHRLSQLGECVT